MAGTKDRKLFIAALGVSLCALAVDRVVFSGGALGPVAAEAAPAASPNIAATLQAPSFEPEPDATTLLADRLKALEQEQGLDVSKVRNAFWLEGVSKGPETQEADDHEAVIEAFRKTHTLRAVMNGPHGNVAIVGTRRLEIGDDLEVSVNGRTERFTLTGTHVGAAGRWAVFNFNGHTVKLGMDARNIAETGG